MDLHVRVRGTLPSWHHYPNAAIAVAVVAVVASAAASPLSGNYHPNNDHKVAIRAAISSALQVVDAQQCQWGG